MIKIIKGIKTSKVTVNKVIALIANLEPKATVNISNDLTCIDIPNGSVQVIWENGIESIFEEDKN